MSSPIALGRPGPFPPAPQSPSGSPRRLETGANALTAPTTPGNRLPVVDRNKVSPELRQAAEGMEVMFLDYMMKVMRETVPKNEMDLESPATAIYRGMQDHEYAQKAARAGGIGLADQLIAYLESQRYTLPRGQGVPTAQPPKAQPAVTSDPGRGTNEPGRTRSSGTGGTHAGQPIHE